ncbi:MAG: fatty acid desaturase [Pseudomonadota bacterium]
MLLAVYAAYLLITAADLPAALSIPLLAVVLAQHSSLQHEVMHGHPFRHRLLSEATVFPAIGLAIPYGRFRDLHMAHHRTPDLTDPYDDPETEYLDPAVHADLPQPLLWLFAFNRTLAGRMAVGPAISLWRFYRADLARLAAGERAVWLAWLLHIAGLLPVFLWLTTLGTMALWQVMVAAYLALSLLKIRTFAEHRAHERFGARSVIIEDRGPLALLFLNNNLHAVHHAHPGVAWYRLPALYAERRARYRDQNGGYIFPTYASLFARYLVRPKEPVAHPLRPRA